MKCGIDKELSDFYVKDSKTGRLHTSCKACYKEHRKTYAEVHYKKYGDQYRARAKIRRQRFKAQFRAKMLDYLSDKSCLFCGESDIRVLEFDHIDPSQKLFSISRAIRDGYSWQQTIDEIKKCRILCANCHKKRTAKQFNWYKANGGTDENRTHF